MGPKTHAKRLLLLFCTPHWGELKSFATNSQSPKIPTEIKALFAKQSHVEQSCSLPDCFLFSCFPGFLQFVVVDAIQCMHSESGCFSASIAYVASANLLWTSPHWIRLQTLSHERLFSHEGLPAQLTEECKDEFPFIVNVLDPMVRTHDCTGILIDSKTVLVPANCVKKQPPIPNSFPVIRVGSLNLTSYEGKEEGEVRDADFDLSCHVDWLMHG